MGENRVKREGTLGKLVEKACCLGDSYLSITQNTVNLNDLNFGYKECKFGSIHSVALMIKNMNGEKNYA